MSAAVAPIGGVTGGRAPLRALLAFTSLAFCMAGIATVAQGALVPVRAEVSQVELNRTFGRSLAEKAPVELAPSLTRAAPVSIEKAHGKAPIATAKLALLPTPAPAQLTELAKPLFVAPGKPLARITVRRLGVRDVILAGPVSHDELAKGPMMVKRGDAASPVTVLAAHRDTHFLFIRDLREGDIVAMQYVTGEVERYRVSYFETVRWNEFAYPLDPPRPLLALTTCYPFGGTEYGGPWRRVAWAERIA